MHEVHVRLPIHNLSALVDFESAARLLSIKLAAEELHKSPSAVSQQIKLLEQQLGFSLFERRTRQIHLTEKGVELSLKVRQMLNNLSQSITDLREGDTNNRLVVSCIHSFAMKWLVKRIGYFTAQNPQYEVQIDSTNKLAVLDQETDIAIRYAPVERAHPHAMLIREELVVVHGPQFGETPVSQNALGDKPLIYENSKANWHRWLNQNNIESDGFRFAQSFGNAGLLVQAAVAGAGIALVPKTIAYDDIIAGNLKVVPGKQLLSDYGYFFAASRQSLLTEKVQLFKSWLTAELGNIQEVG